MAKSDVQVRLPSRPDDIVWARAQFESSVYQTWEIAQAIGWPATKLMSHAKANDWVRAKAEVVAKNAAAYASIVDTQRMEEEKQKTEIIERVSIEMQARVLVTHRADIKNARELCTTLFENFAEQIRTPDPELLIDIGSAATALNKMAAALKTIVLLERQAFGISTTIQEPEDPENDIRPADDAMSKLVNKFASVLDKMDKKTDKARTVDIEPVEEVRARAA